MPFPADTDGGERVLVDALPSDPVTYKDAQGNLYKLNASNRLTLVASSPEDQAPEAGEDEPAVEPDAPDAENGAEEEDFSTFLSPDESDNEDDLF